jgi:hypothetical protein
MTAWLRDEQAGGGQGRRRRLGDEGGTMSPPRGHDHIRTLPFPAAAFCGPPLPVLALLRPARSPGPRRPPGHSLLGVQFRHILLPLFRSGMLTKHQERGYHSIATFQTPREQKPKSEPGARGRNVIAPTSPVPLRGGRRRRVPAAWSTVRAVRGAPVHGRSPGEDGRPFSLERGRSPRGRAASRAQAPEGLKVKCGWSKPVTRPVPPDGWTAERDR